MFLTLKMLGISDFLPVCGKSFLEWIGLLNIKNKFGIKKKQKQKQKTKQNKTKPKKKKTFIHFLGYSVGRITPLYTHFWTTTPTPGEG